ncbi:MAG TPA: alpha/beta fold hydrolase [Roseiflexaceae bacterium]|nr:alpha/beta fold hydrolase [Roseiflexaceae bacterium]
MIDRTEYPFESRFLPLTAGRMHYVDEGQGRPVVLVHGTPTWSFLYRHLIAGLSQTHRCIAPDHLGFGLSDRPADGDESPAAHARNLAELIERLDLRDVTLVVHDFGGPIGLSYAIEHPRTVRQIVLFNTWLWSLKGRWLYEAAASLARGPLGGLVFERLGLEARLVLPAVFGDRRRLTRAAHQQYLRVLATPEARRGTRALARHLIDSSAWYAGLWERNGRLRTIPTLVLWGMRDPVFPPEALERWRTTLLDAQIVPFDDVGHFVPEEKGAELVPVVKYFLEHGPSQFGQQIVGEAGNFKR